MYKDLFFSLLLVMLSAGLSVQDGVVNKTISSDGEEDDTSTCNYFCTENGNETEWISPPVFARPCIPKEIRPIYYTEPGRDYVVIKWTKPKATDRDGDSPSVVQVKGIENGGNFTGALWGKTHTIVYIATDTDGLTDNCFFSVTVIVPSCSKLGTVQNGRYTCTNGTAPGSSCMFECHEGFKTSETGNATCGYFHKTRQFPIWKNVRPCKRIECGLPAVPENGKLTCTNHENTYQTVCNVNCYHGYSATGPTNIICQANETWSKAPVCISHAPEVTECSPSSCNGHTCLLNDNGTFSCKCSHGWSGTLCEDPPDMCAGNICMNGGECNSLNRSYTCSCRSGYSGSLCQVSPVDGNWSDWSMWSKCSVICGSGVRSRQRSCDNPPPDVHGKVCQGSYTESSDCEKDKCEECPALKQVNKTLAIHECRIDINTGLKTCEISCKNGTIPVIRIEGFQTLRCGHETNYYWVPGNVQVPCVVPKVPEVLELETEIMYNSSIPKEQQSEVEDQVRKNINDTSCIQSGHCNTTMNFILNQVDDYTETKLILTFLRYLNYIVNNTGILDQFVLHELQKAISDLESTAEYLRNYTEKVFNVNTSDGLIHADESSLHLQGFVNCTKGHISVNGVCVECPAGTYKRSNMCVFCPKGTFQTLSGQTACIICPLGQTTRTLGSLDKGQCFVECPPGTYFSENNCIFCPKGTFQWLTGQTACVKCPSGRTTKDVGSVSHEQCFLYDNENPDDTDVLEQERSIAVIIGPVVAFVVAIPSFVVSVLQIRNYCKKRNSRERNYCKKRNSRERNYCKKRNSRERTDCNNGNSPESTPELGGYMVVGIHRTTKGDHFNEENFTESTPRHEGFIIFGICGTTEGEPEKLESNQRTRALPYHLNRGTSAEGYCRSGDLSI